MIETLAEARDARSENHCSLRLSGRAREMIE